MNSSLKSQVSFRYFRTLLVDAGSWRLFYTFAARTCIYVSETLLWISNFISHSPLIKKVSGGSNGKVYFRKLCKGCLFQLLHGDLVRCLSTLAIRHFVSYLMTLNIYLFLHLLMERNCLIIQLAGLFHEFQLKLVRF